MADANLQIEYNKAIKALKERIRYYERLGFELDKKSIIPQKPKKITAKSVEKVKAISGAKIKTKSISVPAGYTPRGKKIKPKKQKKPKKTTKKESKKKRSDYYKGSKKKKGKGKPPSEVSETILNTAESFDTSAAFDVSEEDYENENVLAFLEDQLSRLQSFVPSGEWSKNLQSLKQQDVNKALEIISDAVNRHGAYKIAKIIRENVGAITELIEAIMWRYSAIAFIDGRNAVEADLIKLETILNSGDVSLADAQNTSASMEENEWYSGVLE